MQNQPSEDFIKYCKSSLFLLKRRHLLYNSCYCSRPVDNSVNVRLNQFLFLKAERLLHICTIANVHIRIQSHTGTMSLNGPLSGPDGEDYPSSTDNNTHPKHVCTLFVGGPMPETFFFFLQAEAQCVLYFLPLMR